MSGSAFRFSIRELFLLTLVVALVIGWWVDRSRQIERYNRLHYAVMNSGGEPIHFDSEGEVIVSSYYPGPEPKPSIVVDVSKYKSQLRVGRGNEPDKWILPPKIKGNVILVNGKGLVEISLGSDDGLRAAHQLDVFRGTSYVARIKIMKTTPDRAVGQIIKEIPPGSIKTGDKVTTEFLPTGP